MAERWLIESGDRGPRLVMRGPWSQAALKALNGGGVKELELNYAKGWEGDAYSFLHQLTQLEALELTDWNAEDVSAINQLTQLRYLKVFTYCKTELRFSQFPLLEDCRLEWRPKARSLFEHEGVKKLFLSKYSGKDLTAFSGLKRLDSLSLASPKLESLEGIQSLRALTFFGVYKCRSLASLEGIEVLAALRQLEVNDCPKVSDISPLASLSQLRELQLCNDGRIDSFAPLRQLEHLRVFFFYESTDVADGDLSVLKELPELRRVVFMDRRHYSHRGLDFPESKVGS
jgi:hypothetical protein